MQNYRYIIWDWNGTLLDDSWLCIDLFNRALVAEGLSEVAPEYFAEIFCHPVKLMYEQVGFDVSADRFEKITKEFHNGYDRRRSECKLRNGARDLLDRLNSLGCRQSILSAHNEDLLKVAIQEYGLSDYFNTLAGMPDLNAGSKREVGRELILSLDVAPSEMVLIGDTDHDAEVAAELDIDCFLISTGYQSVQRLQATGAEVLKSLLELSEYL